MLVAGVDSSTQSCKVLIVDAATGQTVRVGRADHPDGTEVDPEAWWQALQKAIAAAGGLADVAAISVAGQQHGMVALDVNGEVIRPALLWNDTRSAPEAQALRDHFGDTWLLAQTGSVPVASFTSTKLAWLARHEPANADRLAAVMLPHDWLTWRLAGFGGAGSPLGPDFAAATTDRSDASGTGYFDSRTNGYVPEVLEFCLGVERASRVQLPRVLAPTESAGEVYGGGPRLGAGGGDNAAAAKGLGLSAGEAAVSIGTSGTVFAVAEAPGSGRIEVAGFADMSGGYLPLACTINAGLVLDAVADLLGIDYAEFERLALLANPGADGLLMLPFLQGERTPNLPDATGSLLGLTLDNLTRPNLARAAIESILLSLANALEVFRQTGRPVTSIKLIGGAAANHAVQQVAASLMGGTIEVPAPGEYVALGAARQAAELVGFDTSAWHTEMRKVTVVNQSAELLHRFQSQLNSLS